MCVPFPAFLTLSEVLSISSMFSWHCSVTSHRFTSFFFPSEMNGKLSETRRAKLMDLKKREVEHGGTESECRTCRHEMVLDRHWTGVENHPENRKETSIDLAIPCYPWITSAFCCLFQFFTKYFLIFSASLMASKSWL